MIKTIALKIKDMKDFLPSKSSLKLKQMNKETAKKISPTVFQRRSSSDISLVSCSLDSKSSCRCAINMNKKQSNCKYDEQEEEYILKLLFFAIQYKNVDLLTELCDKLQMYLNVLNEDGISPLHFAAIVGSPDCIKVLLEYGACRNMFDVRGQTPVYYAEMMENKATVDCLQKCSTN